MLLNHFPLTKGNMKTLLLLRHGKSSWDDPSQEDFDRPLSERGVDDTKLSGKYARRQKVKPDLVLSSPATRAKSTTELFIAAAGIKNTPAYDERIYEASARRLLQVLAGFDDDYETVLLIGHNPGFEDLCERLTGAAKKVPTASLTCIELDIEKWTAPKGGKGKLKWRMTPKKLKKDGMKGRTQSLKETP
jgi:phosphohistidine phosphatase